MNFIIKNTYLPKSVTEISRNLTVINMIHTNFVNRRVEFSGAVYNNIATAKAVEKKTTPGQCPCVRNIINIVPSLSHALLSIGQLSCSLFLRMLPGSKVTRKNATAYEKKIVKRVIFSKTCLLLCVKKVDLVAFLGTA